MKRLLLIAAALLMLPLSTSFGQMRHVTVEEFTGSWCGWCVRGTLALQQMDDHYGNTIVAIAVHNQDPMSFDQADSITSGIGYPAQAQLAGYPGGWVDRVFNGGSSWTSDPLNWLDTLNWATGIVDKAVLETPKASVSMSGLTYDPATNMVNVKVDAHFLEGMTGDIRMNVIVTEDSVSGPAGTTWDQHNYYYHNPNFATSPYYNRGSGAAGNGTIAGMYYMHVFRGAIAGIHGAAGIIPSSVAVGQEYSHDFSFPLPAMVSNPNHVHVIGLVAAYSATDPNQGEVFDAVSQPLIQQTPLKIVSVDYTFNPANGFNSQTNTTYLMAKSGGDSTTQISYFNSGSDPITLDLSVDASGLPAGWSYAITPATLTVDAFTNATATLTVSAPAAANFVLGSIRVRPVVGAGEWAPTASYPIYSLGNSTKRVVMNYESPAEAASAIAASSGEGQLVTAFLPMNTDVLNAYPIENMDLAVFANTPMIDNSNYYYVFPNLLPTIESMLANGKRVFVTSDLALTYALDPSAAAGQSEAGTAFYTDTLGLTYRGIVQHVSNNAYTAFQIHGTSDPIGNGLTLTSNSTGTYVYQQYTGSFDVDPAKSVPLFYFNSTAENAGIRYENAAGGRMVYFNFLLNAVSGQVSNNQYVTNNNAVKIAQNAVNWLFSAPSSSVTPVATSTSGLYAVQNPFVGSTEIRYTPKANDGNVSFSVYDVLGREVTTLPATRSGDAFTATFDATGLAHGTYTIVATTAKSSEQVRVIAQ